MAPRSQLAIATGALERLIKEEASYHKELQENQDRLKKYKESEDENRDSIVQLEMVIEQDKKMIPTLKSRVGDFKSKLEAQLESNRAAATSEEITNAETALSNAKTLLER